MTSSATKIQYNLLQYGAVAQLRRLLPEQVGLLKREASRLLVVVYRRDTAYTPNVCEASRENFSSQDLADHSPLDVGQAALDAVVLKRELLVV